MLEGRVEIRHPAFESMDRAMPIPNEGGAFHVGRPGLRKLLGDLEADIMQAIWDCGAAEVTVREVHAGLAAVRPLAYTTVMTVMGNLAKKGLLQARRDGKAHLYKASLSCEQFTEQAVARIVDELARDFTAPAMAHFARAIQDQQP
jgi:predicted transcriptional regulator